MTWDPAIAVALGCSAVVSIAGPVVLALVLWRRTGVSLKAWLFGALTFVVSQFVFRLPWQIPLNAWLAPKIEGNEVATFAWIAVASLTAGLFEETGRWLAYRWLWKDRSTRGGVMLGAGHGGFESIVLVGLSLIGSLVVYVALSHGVTLGIPADKLPLVEKQFSSLTPLLASLGGVERMAAWALHIGCSLLVLEGVRTQSKKWWALSVSVHFAVNLIAVVTMKQIGPVAAEVGTVIAVTLVLFFAVRRSRRSDPAL